jgi:hypothetical protein
VGNDSELRWTPRLYHKLLQTLHFFQEPIDPEHQEQEFVQEICLAEFAESTPRLKIHRERVLSIIQMEKNIMDQPSKDSFRSYLPDPKTSKWGYLDSYDAHNWADEFYKNEFAKKQTQIWKEKFEEPFYGMTVDGRIHAAIWFGPD